MAADHSLHQDAQKVESGQNGISNTFRCRHLKAISVRNLFFPSHDNATLDSLNRSAASLNSFEHRVDDLSPTREQAVSDEEIVSSGSDDEEPVQGSDSQPPGSRSTSPDQTKRTGRIKLPKLRRRNKKDGASVGKPVEKKQPQRPKVIRQVSRSLSTAFAEARQQAFEERISARRLDSFFSLHHLAASSNGEDEKPVYVSETHEKFMNPDFKPLLPEDVPDVDFLRGRTLAVKLWAKRPEEEEFTLLIEELVALPELHYVSEDLGFSLAQFRDNTILFHLPDGIYASYASSTFDPHPGRAASKAAEARTASFDSLMKLKKLVEVIDDATATQETIKRQIEDLLAEHGDHETLSRSTTARFSLQNVSNAAARIDRDITRLKHEKETRRKQLSARKDAFEQARQKLTEQKESLTSLRTEISATSLTHTSLKTSVRSHVARIAEDLLYIFPIEPLAHPPSAASTPSSSRPSSASSSRKRPALPMLAFSIRGLHIPHASILAQHHPPKHDDEVSAALGFVGGIVMFLSRTLLLHIPFPIHVLGSHSVIRDDITPDLDLISNRLLLPSQMHSQLDEIELASSPSDHEQQNGSADGKHRSHRHQQQHHSWAADGARTFPLYARNADPARFRWAVYLLNRDIEELISKNGLRLVDVRDTLANVRLLLVALAGGDKDANLPKREAGRVAGLHSGVGGRLVPSATTASEA